jgi:hypothetical protein
VALGKTRVPVYISATHASWIHVHYMLVQYIDLRCVWATCSNMRRRRRFYFLGISLSSGDESLSSLLSFCISSSLSSLIRALHTHSHTYSIETRANLTLINSPKSLPHSPSPPPAPAANSPCASLSAKPNSNPPANPKTTPTPTKTRGRRRNRRKERDINALQECSRASRIVVMMRRVRVLRTSMRRKVVLLILMARKWGGRRGL